MGVPELFANVLVTYKRRQGAPHPDLLNISSTERSSRGRRMRRVYVMPLLLLFLLLNQIFAENETDLIISLFLFLSSLFSPEG